MKSPPVVLTIAGSDSGAGAGIQADSRAIHALGGFACTAITAVTAQNTLGVTRWSPVAPALLAAQIEIVLSDLPVAALKTGLLPGAPAIRAVARALARHPRRPLVIDPVIGSTSGTRFLDAAGLRALRKHLFPLATLITPNWPEAAALTGLPVATPAEAEHAALALARSAGCAILLKGGHSPDRARCTDLLATPDGRLRRFTAPRLSTRNTHGTGCTLSAALAAALARGLPLAAAVALARALLRRGLRAHLRLSLGAGRGPAFPGLQKPSDANQLHGFLAPADKTLGRPRRALFRPPQPCPPRSPPSSPSKTVPSTTAAPLAPTPPSPASASSTRP